ncbi:MAG: aminoacyl-histidine dipeptidase [Dorea sp.]|nr:aminoacyl-histidine dipeptidase [Dorea sp.]
MEIQELTTKKVFRYFKELAAIPHGSGNTKGVEEYCIRFAEEHGLAYFHDAFGNVMIFKDATPGYEGHDPVILQGHLDMVCEKVPGCAIDMEKEAIVLQTDGEYLWAKGTTLGADNGIAVAFVLALLDSQNGKHPPIEALFTIDEEVGLKGAHGLDVSKLKGTRLINIDSEDEGILTVSCAGAARVQVEVPVTEGTAGECAIEISVKGLMGGHSGMDISKDRKNAAKALGEVLDHMNKTIDFNIASLSAGGRLNVIPQNGTVVITCKGKDVANVFDAVQEYSKLIKKGCGVVEPNLFFEIKATQYEGPVTDKAGTEKLIAALFMFPHGVTAMDPNIKDLVLTSLNMGSVEYKDGKLTIGFMIRSNADYGRILLKNQITAIARCLGGDMEVITEYPAWEYLQNSPLRDVMSAAYEDLYGEAPQITAIHAGLECGIILTKLPDLDCVSFGPTMKGVHTPEEKLDIHSAERTFHYFLHILENL